MEQTTKGKTFNINKARQQRDQLRNEIRLMEEEHNRFIQETNDVQQLKTKERISNMEKERERLIYSFLEMDQEINKPNPDQNPIVKQAREMENAVTKWQSEYQHIASEMGIEKMKEPIE